MVLLDVDGPVEWSPSGRIGLREGSQSTSCCKVGLDGCLNIAFLATIADISFADRLLRCPKRRGGCLILTDRAYMSAWLK